MLIFLYNKLKDKSGQKYEALIDIGAYFVGIDNETVAHKLIDICGYENVIYLDDENVIVILNKNKSIIKLEKSDVLENTIIYYDQKHTTGIDIKQIKDNAIGLVLLRHDNDLRDYGQGSFRLRKINITQYVDICVDNKIFTEIIENDGNDERKPSKRKLLNYLINNLIKKWNL